MGTDERDRIKGLSPSKEPTISRASPLTANGDQYSLLRLDPMLYSPRVVEPCSSDFLFPGNLSEGGLVPGFRPIHLASAIEIESKKNSNRLAAKGSKLVCTKKG